jgi:hypothetical protein
LHCSDNESWKAITDKIGNLSIREVNEDPRLKDNAIEMTAIRKACLILDVKIMKSETNHENSLRLLVKCLLERSNALQILRAKNVSELNVFGYYYQPYNYIEKTGITTDIFYVFVVLLYIKYLLGASFHFMNKSL